MTGAATERVVDKAIKYGTVFAEVNSQLETSETLTPPS